MKVSVVVPAYKDVVALKLILEAFNRQTYKDFEVIVAEDDDSIEVSDLIAGFKSNYPIKHFQHKDVGYTTKPIAVNGSIRMSEGDYLIFIDGDTIPYSTFIDGHVELSKEGVALCGRRVNLGKDISDMIRNGEVCPYELERNYIKKYLFLKKSNTRHFEKGVYVKPNGFLHKIFSIFDRNVHLLGSNFSCYKKDMLEINGSDEDMRPGAGTDDVDIEWRLKAIGVKIISCKNTANLFHLFHERNDNRPERAEYNRKVMAEKKEKNQYRCTNGIYKL